MLRRLSLNYGLGEIIGFDLLAILFILPVHKKWVEDCKALGVKDPEGIMEAYLKIMKKYGQDRMYLLDNIK